MLHNVGRERTQADCTYASHMSHSLRAQLSEAHSQPCTAHTSSQRRCRYLRTFSTRLEFASNQLGSGQTHARIMIKLTINLVSICKLEKLARLQAVLTAGWCRDIAKDRLGGWLHLFRSKTDEAEKKNYVKSCG